MKKTVTCAACRESYSIDLKKYGGKTIKCKKCKAAIAVPAAADDPDGFEVIDESPSPGGLLPSGQAAARVPPSILQRHRTASQKGAVNVALLQRFEDSRREIRETFLAVHGSEESRVPESLKAIDESLGEIEERIGSDRSDEEIDKFKGLLGRLVAPPFSANLFWIVSQNMADENLLAEALRVIGPRRNMSQKTASAGEGQKDESVGEVLRKEGARQWEILKEHMAGNRQKVHELQKGEKGKRDIATVETAIEILEQRKQKLKADRTALRQKRDKEIAGHSQQTLGRLTHARELMLSGQLAEATVELQGLLPVAPVKLLDDVLLLLSQCSHLSGNASNTARQIQDAICFGASAPVGMDEDYNDLWAKASAGLPKA